MTDNVALLLGAGSSIPAGFPSTEELTKDVLCAQDVCRCTDGKYRINKDLATEHRGIHRSLDNFVRLTRLIVQYIDREANIYYSKRPELNKTANYEDIFYMAKQVYNDEWEIENPANRCFIEGIKSYISSIEKHENTYKILDETCDYITDLVCGGLSNREAQDINHLTLIRSICNDFNVTCISTLCHDTHIEKYLEDQGINIADGFSHESEAGVRYWNCDFSSDGKIPFLKVHGSVDWFRFRPMDSDGFDDRIGIPVNGDCEHTKTKDGIWQNPLNGGRPLLLIGTFNKMSDYSRSIFLDLFYHLRSALDKADTMIVCGYSFGDKGINGEITNWYWRKRERRFVIIHPDPYQLIKKARPAIWGLFCEEHPITGRPGIAVDSTTYIRKKLECVDVDEIRRAIASHP